MSPAEAVSRVNESVVVDMVVRRTKCCTGSRQVFLDSEADHRDPKNLGVVVTELDGRRGGRRREAVGRREGDGLAREVEVLALTEDLVRRGEARHGL